MMETNKVIVQKLKHSVSDNYQLAEKYYSILSAVNDLKLTQREIQLIAFTAIRGNMSYNNIREDFCNKFNTSSPTINNIISKLKKIGVLIKDRGKIKVNPAIILNFNFNVILQISLLHETN
jgi:hypothetical protein